MEETKSEKEPTREEQVDALKSYLTREDREAVIRAHGISKPTYYRIISSLDFASPVLLDLVARAQANKRAQAQAHDTLKQLV